MGYFVELNTLLKFPKDFNTKQLKIGETYTVIKDKERVFPLHIAILLVKDDWTFLGYGVVNTAEIKEQKTKLTFDVISLFNPEEQKLYRNKFLAAAKITGEV